MNLDSLKETVIEALEDIKARDIEVMNVAHLTSMFDCMIVASADSTRQRLGLARSVQDSVSRAGGHVGGVEGERDGEWILVDLGPVVVHIMQPAVREYYNLEELWGSVRPRRVPSVAGHPGGARAGEAHPMP
jgi:ribosome-associated protein